MKAKKTFVLVSFLFAGAALQTATAGRIIGLSDDWMLGNDFSAPGCTAAQFAGNAFAWLTEPSGNRNILIDSGYQAHDLTPLLTLLGSAGYSVTLSDPSTWSASTFSSYGTVVWERGIGGANFDGSQLVPYVNGTGSVLMIGGYLGGSQMQHNNFLNVFKIQESAPIDSLHYDITSYVPDPLTAGVTLMEAEGPGPMSLMSGSSARVLSYQNGIDWIVALDTVPEPSGALLLVLGGGVWLARRRS